MKNQPFPPKSFLLFILSVAFSAKLFSQYTNKEQYPATKSVTIYTSEFQKGKIKLRQFLNTLNIEILNEQLNSNSYELNFTAQISQTQRLDSLFTTLGYITNSRQNNNNIKYTVNSLKNQIEDHQTQIDRIRARGAYDSTSSQRYNTEYQINNYTDRIKEANRTLATIKENENKIYVDLDFRDELSVPSGNSKVTWAKMPGIAYNYLKIENPKHGVSDRVYTGLNLKYIFTKGKSFFQVGVLKAQNNSNLSADSLMIIAPQTFNEFFTVEFGQDFYTKHFGRGNRKFLNLYSGYTIGGMIPNKRNDENLGFVPVLNLSMGVEILKTKHILLDTRGSYFLPLNGINRNTRGILLGASFNFVF